MIHTAVTITTMQAEAACAAISQAIHAEDIEDAETWHGGLGSDLCEFCQALVVLRAATGRAVVDCLRP